MATLSEKNAAAQATIDAFGFTRLKITAFVLNGTSIEELDSKTLPLNPSGYTRKFKARGKSNSGSCGEKLKADGKIFTPKTVQFKEEISLKLTLDHTGVIPDSEDVVTIVEWLEKFIAGYNGEQHSTPYVQLEWGYLNMKGQLLDMEVDFQMFNQDGIPLRAGVSLTVGEVYEPGVQEAQNQSSSPDLTHARVVRAGDTLPALCQAIYKDPSLYMQVAEANGLASFTQLTPGETIYFPPLRSA
jgi:hypothetical protein